MVWSAASSGAFERPSHFCLPDVPGYSRAEEAMIGSCLAITTLELVVGNVILRSPLYLVDSIAARIFRLRNSVSQLVTIHSIVRLWESRQYFS